MKALRLIKGHGRLEEQEIEPPSIGPRDVLIRVKAAGICHSDAHYRGGFLSESDLPVTLGHEIAGVVENAGNDVRSFRKGDRVCLHYLVTCGDVRVLQSGHGTILRLGPDDRETPRRRLCGMGGRSGAECVSVCRPKFHLSRARL